MQIDCPYKCAVFLKYAHRKNLILIDRFWYLHLKIEVSILNCDFIFSATVTDYTMFIALTGGIGCGKSAALEAFAECGFQVADADKLCHQFYDTNDGVQALLNRWPSVFDSNGRLDRKKLADIVFRDENELACLENMVTPFLHNKLNDLRLSGISAIVEVPLLFEKELAGFFDAVCCVWSPFYLRRSRLAQRGWDHAECARRERLQWSPESKLAASDYGIINSGSRELLHAQCRIIAGKLK